MLWSLSTSEEDGDGDDEDEDKESDDMDEDEDEGEEYWGERRKNAAEKPPIFRLSLDFLVVGSLTRSKIENYSRI